MKTEKKNPKGRPTLNRPMQAISVRIDKELYRKTKMYCAASDKKMAFVINEALKVYFNNTTQKYIENKMHVYIDDESK